MGYKLKFLPKILYKLKHGNLSEEETHALQTSINNLVKSKLHAARNVPDGLGMALKSEEGWSSPISGMKQT